jgi:hypothetical protein
MLRLRFALIAAALILAPALPGCGESQPNPPAAGATNDPEAVKKTSEMMRDATKGSTPKTAKPAAPAK